MYAAMALHYRPALLTIGVARQNMHAAFPTGPYEYRDAATLLADFWATLKRGVARDQVIPDAEGRHLQLRGARWPHAVSVASQRVEGLVHVDGGLRQGALRRQPRTAARHRREGVRFAEELALMTGTAKSPLPHYPTTEGYGLVRLERDERGRITPKVARGGLSMIASNTNKGG
jgi:hypothetical protein